MSNRRLGAQVFFFSPVFVNLSGGGHSYEQSEQQSRFFLFGFTRINLEALLIVDIFISDFRYDYCGSIPLATVLGINVGDFGAAVLF